MLQLGKRPFTSQGCKEDVSAHALHLRRKSAEDISCRMGQTRVSNRIQRRFKLVSEFDQHPV